MSYFSNWTFPTNIRFGSKRIDELGNVCKLLNINNPLLVTDKNLKKSLIINKALSIMESKELGSSVYSDVDQNPSNLNLENGINKFNSGNHDGIIAFGGGSALDLGKLIAFMAKQTLPVWDFEDIGDLWKKANTKVIFPIIAIPTTAGTGSEVGRASVLTNTEINIKKVIFHPQILPKEVICDPNLTISLPKSITAGTGMDAFAHCLEAFCSPNYHPMGDGIALEGMRLVKENLLDAFTDGANIRARSNMMSAALMGATAFQKGLGGIHALSHPIGALYNTHHGTTNAIVMKEVLLFNKKSIEDKIESLTSYLKIKNNFNGFIDFIENICDELNIPKKLRELGVDKKNISLLAKMAIKDPTAGGNPVEIKYKDALKLLDICI